MLNGKAPHKCNQHLVTVTVSALHKVAVVAHSAYFFSEQGTFEGEDAVAEMAPCLLDVLFHKI